jgi:hypothetical protein
VSGVALSLVANVSLKVGLLMLSLTMKGGGLEQGKMGVPEENVGRIPWIQLETQVK